MLKFAPVLVLVGFLFLDASFWRAHPDEHPTQILMAVAAVVITAVLGFKFRGGSPQ
jgi:hypothetical protein